MRSHIKLWVLILSILTVFALAACDEQPPAAQSQGEAVSSLAESESSVTEGNVPESSPEEAASASSSEETESEASHEESEASQPEESMDPNALQAYEDAVAILDDMKSMRIEFEVVTVKQVGTDSFEDKAVGFIQYAGLSTISPRAMVTTTHILGEDQFESVENYAANHAYYSFTDEDYAYKCDQSFDEFFERQIPYKLLSPDCYASVVFDPEDPAVILFSEGHTPEPWISGLSEYYWDIDFSAEGWARITEGTVTELYYNVTYMRGSATYTCEYRIKPAFEDLTQEDLIRPAKREYITVSDLSVPYALRYAACGINRYRQGSYVLYEEFYNYGHEDLKISEITINTCPDDSMEQALHATEIVSLFDGDKLLFTTSLYQKYVDGKTYMSEQEGVWGEESAVGLPAAYMNHEFLKTLPLPSYADFRSINIETVGSFIILDGELKPGAAAPYLRRAGMLESFNEGRYENSTTSSLACRFAIDRDTGLLTAAQVMLVAQTTVRNGQLIAYYRDLSLSTGAFGAYAAIFEAPSPDEEIPDEERPTPLFYQVTDEKGNKAYLLGTIHVGDSMTAYLPQSIYDALNSSDALAVESNLNTFEERLGADEELAQAYYDSLFFNDDTTLQDFLNDPELYKQTELMLFAMGYGNYATTIKPAAAASIMDDWLMSGFGYLDSEKGVDMRLLNLAEEAGKKIYEIEDPKAHYNTLTDYSKETQVMILEEALSMEKWDTMYSTLYLYQLWCGGDEELLKEAVSTPLPEDATPEEKEYYEEYTKKMITERDKIMADGIKSYLKSGETVFVAVGLAHVIGEDGIIDQLKEAGYTVTRVE